MFKYIIKQIRRSAVTNVLFCLLLTLAGMLLCISAGLWYSAHKAMLDIDETITTIAIPDHIAIKRLAVEIADEKFPGVHDLIAARDHYNINPDDNMVISQYYDAIAEAEREILQNIREVVYPSGVLQMDERRSFNAFSDIAEPIPLRVAGVGVEPYLALYSGQAIAAFIVTCEKIDTDTILMNNPYSWMYNYGVDPSIYQTIDRVPFIQESSSATFTVNEILHLQSSHTEPRYIRVNFDANHDGSAPFERGKQYIIIGGYDKSSTFGIGELVIEKPNVEIKNAVIGQVHNNEELDSILSLTLWWDGYELEEESFPVDIKSFMFTREPVANDGWYSFVEVTGSVEETLTSVQGQLMREALENADVSTRSFQVITTNNPNSLLRFNQNRNLFAEGRSFSSAEIEEGARVCLVSRQFAEQNELTVGDTLPLQMYNSVIGALAITYLEAEAGGYATDNFWIPSLYSSNLEISPETEFTIVGVYNTLRLDRSEFSIPPNTVIIPDGSIGELAGEAISRFDTSFQTPMLADSMIVPNGRINEIKAAIDDVLPGYGGLFRFYDQGYNSLVRALGNLRFGMTWILSLSAAGWVAVLFIFLMFYVTRRRKEASLLYAIGVSRAKRFIWVYSQCTILILLALGISIAVSLPLYGDILDIAGGTVQEFTDSFRDLTLSVAVDSGLRSRIPLDRSPIALIITVAGGAAITLVAAGVLSSRSAAFKSLNEKRGDD